MTPGEFNARFRPLVNEAWLLACETTGQAPNNAAARDVWYRQQIRDATHGRISSTKDATPDERRALIERFRALTAPTHPPMIDGWTPAQNDHFANLARAAWSHAQTGHWRTMDHWLDDLLEECGVRGRWAPNHRESFDRVMAALAVTAGDQFWLERTAHAAEIRMRFQINVLLGELSEMTGEIHDWRYCRGIWRQADQLPEDINDAPAKLLWLVLQILDSHIRRKSSRVRPRATPPAKDAPAPKTTKVQS